MISRQFSAWAWSAQNIIIENNIPILFKLNVYQLIQTFTVFQYTTETSIFAQFDKLLSIIICNNISIQSYLHVTLDLFNCSNSFVWLWHSRYEFNSLNQCKIVSRHVNKHLWIVEDYKDIVVIFIVNYNRVKNMPFMLIFILSVRVLI